MITTLRRDVRLDRRPGDVWCEPQLDSTGTLLLYMAVTIEYDDEFRRLEWQLLERDEDLEKFCRLDEIVEMDQEDSDDWLYALSCWIQASQLFKNFMLHRPKLCLHLTPLMADRMARHKAGQPVI